MHAPILHAHHSRPYHRPPFTQVPPNLKLSVKHTALNALISEGIIGTDDQSCYITGSAAPRQLYCLEHYTLDLDGGKYFEQDSNSLLLHAGVQEVPMRVTWATRMVRCYITSADAAGWRQMQAKEAYARISAFMQTHEIVFDGAGDEHLPRVTQVPTHLIALPSHLLSFPSPLIPISSHSHLLSFPSPLIPISSHSHRTPLPISSHPHLLSFPSPLIPISSHPHLISPPSDRGVLSIERVTQAWSIAHTNEPTMRANRETIAGLAAILREYPELKITVHGETGAASFAPRRLADHLSLHYQSDVGKIMDQLARHRAQACIDALVAQVTWLPLGLRRLDLRRLDLRRLDLR
jgi:hypothetical protein